MVRPSPAAQASLRLAEALTARLCHDLAGPLGAITGALELAGTDPDLLDEALPVATDGAQALARRLALLRAAWGPAEASLDAAGLRRLALGLPQSRHVHVTLVAIPDVLLLAPTAARVLLAALLVGVECLHGAGTLEVSADAKGCVLLLLTGARAAWPQGLGTLLADAAACSEALERGITARLLAAPLLALLAHDAGLQVRLLHGVGAEPPPLMLALGPAS